MPKSKSHTSKQKSGSSTPFSSPPQQASPEPEFEHESLSDDHDLEMEHQSDDGVGPSNKRVRKKVKSESYDWDEEEDEDEEGPAQVGEEEDSDSDDDWSAKKSKKGKGKKKSTGKKKNQNKSKNKKSDGSWADIPNWKGKKGVPFFDLPSEIIDMILGSPLLTIIDHVALASTSKILRAGYYTPLPDTESPLWAALLKIRPAQWEKNHTQYIEPAGKPFLFRAKIVEDSETESDEEEDVKPTLKGSQVEENSNEQPFKKEMALVNSIWSNKIKIDKVKVMGWMTETENAEKTVRMAKYRMQDGKPVKIEAEPIKVKKVKRVVRTKEWDNAIQAVNSKKIAKSNISWFYKLSESQINTLSFQANANFANSNKRYSEAAVLSTALAYHGGYFGHKDYLNKAEEKRNENRNKRYRRRSWY